MISIVHVRNPLQPSDGRTIHEAEYIEERRLVEYLWTAFSFNTHILESLTASVNGQIIPRDQWSVVVPRDGDFIVCTPILAGGSLWRTLASVAVLAVAAAVTAGAASGALAFAFTLGASTAATTATVASLIGGAVLLGGNLLVSALLGPSSPSNKTPSASYDPDGPKSLARSGTVIPKGYGTFRSGGNIIASFTDVEGPDQYINALVCYGFGPARSVAGIQINGKDVATYQNVQYYTRLGANDQQPIVNFNRIVNGYPQSVQCLAGEPVVVPGTGTETQALQVDIMFPDGVFFVTSKGNVIEAVVTYTVEYSVSGANDWQPVLQPYETKDVVSYGANGLPLIPHAWCVVATDMPPHSGVVYALDDGPHTPGDAWTGQQQVETFAANGNHSTYNKTCVGEWQMTNPALNQVLVVTWRAGYQDFVGASQSPLYNRTSIYGLAAGKYDVRVTKYGSAEIHDDVQFGDNASPNIGQQVWIHSVNEISLLDLAYPNMILIGVRALATNQLSGSSLNVTAEITYGLRSLDEGLLPDALKAYEEDNPACVAADAMLDDLYGGGEWPGITKANINRYIDEWVSWANLNDQLVDDGNGGSIRRHVFNGVLDDEASLWDQVNKVGRMSRAAVIPIGRDYGVFVDQPDTPVQMFTMGNIVDDSFQETWLAIDDRANQIEITFADKTRYYRTDNPLVYMDPANQDAGVIIKNVRIDGKGITVPAQAWHLARFKERSNQFLLRTGSFKCDLDAVAVRPGNVAILQHDVPQWGWGGRTLPSSTASAIFPDRNDLPFVAGTSYNVIVLHPALQRYAGTITAVTPLVDSTGVPIGTQLGLSSFDNENRVTRAIVTGIDSPISSTAAGNIVVQPAAGATFAVGQVYTLFDTDVLETRPVVGISAVDGSLMLGTPLSQQPQDFSTYFYGPVGTQKLIRVTNIRKSSEFRCTIEWIDYDSSVYIDATPVIGETSAVSTSSPGVTSLMGVESFQQVGGSQVGYAQLSWALGKDTVGVAIYGATAAGNAATLGAQPTLLARLPGYPTSWQTQVNPGETWTYIVVGFDTEDDYAAFNTAPRVTIGVVGVATNLLLDSTFASGFTYWNLLPRGTDQITSNTTDGGQADYTVASSAMSASQALYYQIVPQSSWSVGQYLILSAYLQDACASSTAPNTGSQTLTLAFFNASNALISKATASIALNGVTPTITRVQTASTQIPAGTTSLQVWVGFDGGGTVQVGSVLTSSHWLLEAATAAQTAPSAWADVDATGHVTNLFQAGSSTGLRVQGSLLPSFTGNFSYAYADTTITISWDSLVILWPDGSYTVIANGSMAFTGLTAATDYYAFLYWDIVAGRVSFATPMSPVGTPAMLSTSYDVNADAACRQDGRVRLTTGGLQITTGAAGTAGGAGGTGTGTGGGSGGNGPINAPALPNPN